MTRFCARRRAINRAVHDLVARYGGSISAEHGIGQLKRDELVRYKTRSRSTLMRAIKQALDPQRDHESRQGARRARLNGRYACCPAGLVQRLSGRIRPSCATLATSVPVRE